MADSFERRLGFNGDINDVLQRSLSACGLGTLESQELITVGFQDYNVRTKTESGEYLIKIFAKDRDEDQSRPSRYVDVMQAALAAGVHHPKLFIDSNGEALHVDAQSGLRMAIMAYIHGRTFYDAGGDFHVPTDNQLKQIAAEAVKIHAIPGDFPPIFDEWAIPNMQWMYDQTKQYLSDEGRQLVVKAFKHFHSIPMDRLPKSFVHGDIIKTNVIMGDDGKAYILDFAVANIYPRIQELAVMSANLMFDGETSLQDRVEKVIASYELGSGVLTDIEKKHVFNYALPGAAMEYMGSVWERDVNGDDSPEINHWIQLGLGGLRQAL